MTQVFSGDTGASAVLPGSVTNGALAAGAVNQSNLAANVVGNGPAFSYSSSSVTNVGNGATTVLVYATKDFDTHNAVSASTFTAPVAGYYWFVGSCYVGSPIAANSTITLALYKNTVKYAQTNHTNGIAAYDTSQVTAFMLLATGDTVDVRVVQNTGVTINTTADTSTKFSGFLARSA
jgi:hypothetical protein